MFWAGYNTDIGRVLSPEFPNNTLDLLHGLRAFLPILSACLAMIFLLVKRPLSIKPLFGPLGLLMLYTILGIISSIFSKDPVRALYWAVMYGAVILVLWAIAKNSNSLHYISFIIKANWAIAAIISIGLLVFFLIQPGAISSLTSNFLICSQRPYETLGNIKAEIGTIGMAGTRPTGLGRYAGLVAIIAFVKFCYNKKRLKFFWFFLFLLFLFILLFSKGKTEIIAFIIAIIFILWLRDKLKTPLILVVGVVLLLGSLIIFYNIPCTNSISFVGSSASKNSAPESIVNPPATPPATPPANTLTLKNIKSISTLGGRTTGVWREGWKLFLSSPLIGYGFQADRIFLEGQHVHNTLLQALIQTGLLGTIPFVFAFIITGIILFHLLKSFSVTKEEKIFLIEITAVLIFFIIRGITESLAFFSSDWLFIAPLLAYITILNQKNLFQYNPT